jgi:hypothetical protein
MLLAQEFDAVDDRGRAHFSPERRRLIDPELRARVAGYLAAGEPVAGVSPPHRTDGVWVWPETLASAARRGIAPQPQLLEHLRSRDCQPTGPLAAATLALATRAVAGPVTLGPPPLPATYLAVRPAGSDVVSHVLRRVAVGVGRVIDELSTPGLGWRGTDLARPGRGGGVSLAEVSAEQASALLDELCARAYAEQQRWTHEQEPEPDARSDPADGPRLARVFDAADRPFFSPSRLRIRQPRRRERIETYLSTAPLVLRATEPGPDPFAPTVGPVVPLSYRSDGAWVWSEALAHFLRTRGVAPPLPLLTHIEANGCRLPSTVEPAALARATRSVCAPGAFAALASPALPAPHYYTAVRAGPAPPLLRALRGDVTCGQALHDDLRWHDSDELWRVIRGGAHGYQRISEERAAEIVDERWLIQWAR